MTDLLEKIEALESSKKETVVEKLIEEIDKDKIGASLMEAAKNEICLMDYDDVYSYTRKIHGLDTNGYLRTIRELVEYVKDEDEDEYSDIIDELTQIINN